MGELGRLDRRRRANRGQALGEVAILTALATGLKRLEVVLRPYADDPRALWGGAGALALVLVLLLRPKR